MQLFINFGIFINTEKTNTMKIMKRLILLFIASGFMVHTIAQTDSVDVVPLQVSFFYPFGTAGTHSINNGYIFSLNIIAGVTGAADGIEIGGIANTNRYYNHGLQLAGICNITGTSNTGAQIAGICNILGGSTNGAQLAGISNVSDGSLTGVQVSGILNINTDSANGAQLAGITNVSGSINGLQAAGISNIAGTTEGCQIAGIANISGDANVQLAGIGNISGSVNGIQIGGIYNVAGYVKGVQLAGIINICDSIDGVPLALVSIVRKNGYRRWDIWTSEAFYVNVSFKIGIRELYTILSLGYRPGNLHNNTGLGVGLGTNMPLWKRSDIDVEAHMYQISRFLWMEEDNFMYTLRINYVQHLSNRLAIFAGPAFNILGTDYFSDAYKIAPGYGIEYRGSNDWQYWLGFNAGIRF